MISNTAAELREFFVEGREALLRRPAMVVVQREETPKWLDEHCELVDETLRRICAAAWKSARGENTRGDNARGENARSEADGESAHSDSREYSHREGEPEIALLALGGYGRRELCPYSDIDIAFVPAEEENPLLDAVIKEAFRLVVEVFIDGAKMEVGYAYRPLADCPHLDHTAKAALLESRLIIGSENLHRAMQGELRRHWDGVDFVLEKIRERRVLADDPRYSLYAVEPNLKEGVGALRELQSALWSAGALHASEHPLRDLEWRGLMTSDDCRKAREANEFLLRLRVWLHLSNGKKGDVLAGGKQESLARDLSYAGNGLAPWQSLMKDYYLHAENALRFSQRVMRRLLEGPLPLDDHFVARHRRVRAAHPHVLRNHPELLLTPFALAQKYGFGVDAELDRAIEEALPRVNDKVRSSPIVRAGFLALLGNVSQAAVALTDLRARGILGKLIPEFAAMLHLSPADPSHELTVGEHSIFAVRRLGEMYRERGEDEMMHDIWDGIDDPELLVIATLLHDVGKIEPNTEHSVSGEVLARAIGERIGLNAARCDRLALLVRRHLLLPRASRLRDVSEPGTIRSVVEQIGDVSTLKMLYLLSVADTRSVGARSYSNLEIEAMRELYERVLAAMTRAESALVLTDSEAREELAQRERSRVRREMRRLELDDETMQQLCDNLPASYVLNTPLPTVAAHLKFLDQLPQEKLIVDFYQPPRDPYTEMSVIAYDDETPGLLSKICGAVYVAGLSIHQAQVFTLSEKAVPRKEAPETEREYSPDSSAPARGIVLDRLVVSREGRALSTAQGARLAALLRELLIGGKTLEEVLSEAGKSVAAAVVPQRISLRNDLSDEHSALTVVGENVPGLLFYMTRALASMNLDIHSAKVASWAGRAEDAFYITRRENAESDGERHDRKIADEDIRQLLDELRLRLRKPALQSKAPRVLASK